MKHEDYTKYSENSNNIEPVIPEVPEIEEVTETTENVEENLPEVPEVGENLEPNTPELPENTETDESQNTILPGDAKLIGVVIGCSKLNVRKEPSKDSTVLCVINKDEEVEFDTEEEITYEDFHRIITSTGVKGYCMKKFIEIK